MNGARTPLYFVLASPEEQVWLKGRFSMRKLVALAVLLLSSLAAAEDPQLRETAVALLEKANAVSAPAVWPPYDSVVTFRYFSSQGVKDGQEALTWLSPRQFRIETRFGDFHLINVFTANRL